MSNATETAAAPKLSFDRVTCSRCGGSGRYSYCQTMNGKYGPETCFRCKGAGQTLTKKGEAASALLTRAYSKPAEELQPGDVVRSIGGRTWERVVRAYQQTAEDNTGYAHSENGPRYYFCVETERSSQCTFDPRGLYRVAQSAERKAVVMPLVAEYQELLTKAGKPRKATSARVAAILEELGVAPAAE